MLLLGLVALSRKVLWGFPAREISFKIEFAVLRQLALSSYI